VTCTIDDPVKKGAKSVVADTLYYTLGDTLFTAVGGTNTGGNNYSFSIPGAPVGRDVTYYISAWDDQGARTDDGYYGFRVLKVKSPAGLAAAPSCGPNGVQLNWSSPRDTALYYWTGQPYVGIWGGDTTSANPAQIYATRFTPMYTPCRVQQIAFYFYPMHLAYANVIDTGTVTYHVWSDSNGIPGHDLITPFTYTLPAPLANAFVTFNLGASAPLVTGDYIVGCEYTNAPNALVDTLFGVKPPYLVSDMGTSDGRNLDYHNSTWYDAGANFRIRTIDYYGPGAKLYASQHKYPMLPKSKHQRRMVSDQPVVAENTKNLDSYTVERDSALTGFVPDWVTGLNVLTYTDNTLVDLTTYRYRVKSIYTAPDTFGLSNILTVFADFGGPNIAHTPITDTPDTATFVTYFDLSDTSGIHVDSIHYWQPPTAGTPITAVHDSITGGNRYWYHLTIPTRDSVYYYVDCRDNSLWNNYSSSTTYTFRTNLGVAGQPTASTYTPFFLANVRPNPMSRGSAAEFQFGLPQACPVKLAIYNVMGQRIATLADGNLPAGRHTIRWNGSDQSGQKAASGVYIYKLQAGSNMATKKMIVVK